MIQSNPDGGQRERPTMEHEESRTRMDWSRTSDPPVARELDTTLEEPPEWTTRAGRRNMREKTAAGLRGLKHALRGDSSYFAHAYRGLLIVLTGVLLNLNWVSWLLILISLTMVVVAELAHSALDTLARALGDPEEQGLRVAREIATAGVLVSVTTMAIVAVTIFALRLNALFGWW